MSDYPGKLVPEDLAGFLRARLAEEEDRIGFARSANAAAEPFSYNRLLADIKAKRQIIDDWMDSERMVSAGVYHEQVPTGSRMAARCLASVYSDHSDYDPEWTP